MYGCLVMPARSISSLPLPTFSRGRKPGWGENEFIGRSCISKFSVVSMCPQHVSSYFFSCRLHARLNNICIWERQWGIFLNNLLPKLWALWVHKFFELLKLLYFALCYRRHNRHTSRSSTLSVGNMKLRRQANIAWWKSNKQKKENINTAVS